MENLNDIAYSKTRGDFNDPFIRNINKMKTTTIDKL